MKKVEVKKLFWTLVNSLHDISDTTVQNEAGVITERGMTLSNGYYVLFGLDDGIIRFYNNEHKVILELNEENELLLVIKDLCESTEILRRN